MKSIMKFIADDGTEHLTEADCIAHEAKSGFRTLVERYLHSPANQYPGHASLSIARNAILGFEEYRHSPEATDGPAFESLVGKRDIPDGNVVRIDDTPPEGQEALVAASETEVTASGAAEPSTEQGGRRKRA